MKSVVTWVVGFVLFNSSLAQGSDLFDMSLEDLMDVKVTAQKREEDPFDVPLALTIVDPKDVHTHAINIEAWQHDVPSVSFRKGNTTRNSAVTIRGIGTVSFSIAAEPSVSTVVDGVVMGRSGQAFLDMYDLERIEVLKGPQGSLFGKNASAGVINITTQAPQESFQVKTDISAFEGPEVKLQTSITGAVSERTRARLALYRGYFSGFIDNVYNNETVNGYDRQGARLRVDHDISGDSQLKLFVDSYKADDDCCADIEGLPSGRNPQSEAAPNSNGLLDGGIAINTKVDHDFPSLSKDESDGIAVHFETSLLSHTLTSISAFRRWQNTEVREGDFTSIGGTSSQPVFSVPFQLHDLGEQNWLQSSQELRLSSDIKPSYDYQVGLFLWHMASERNFNRAASCQNDEGQMNQILADNPGITCNANDIVDATAYMSSDFKNYAVFGQGRIALTEALSVLLGARYTYDEVAYKHQRKNNDEFGRQGVGVSPATLDTQFGGDTSADNFSAKLGLQWKLQESLHVYGHWTQGYKGPGFNVFYNMQQKDQTPINAERSDAYEFGIKFKTERLELSTALFYTQFEDYQANNFDTFDNVTITRLTNAGSVITQGIEWDSRWSLTEQQMINWRFAYTNAAIDEFKCPVGELCSNRSGLNVPFSPDFKSYLEWRYTVAFAGNNITTSLSHTYAGKQQSVLPDGDGSIEVEGELPSYQLSNASITFQPMQSSVSVAVEVRNIFDEGYITTYSGDGFRYQLPRDGQRYFGLVVRVIM